MVAAWAGHRRAVVLLLADARVAADVRREGSPPQTSSCGGRGAKTAAAWARRKAEAFGDTNYLQIATAISGAR